MYICLCKGLKESQVRQAATNSGGDAGALIMSLGWDDEDCCGRCAKHVDELIETVCDDCPFITPLPVRR